MLWFLVTTALAGVIGHMLVRFYSDPLNRRLRVKFWHEAPKKRGSRRRLERPLPKKSRKDSHKTSFGFTVA